MLALPRPECERGGAVTAAPNDTGSFRRRLIGAVLGFTLSAGASAMAQPVRLVAAENFYGDIAKQIGGPGVAVTSILNNPDQDPHLFEVSPSVGRDVSAARIVVYNGIDYDPWMAALLKAARSADRKVVVAAELIGKKTGDNPHIWYDPATMPALAKVLADILMVEDAAHLADYRQRLADFGESLKPIQAKIGAMRQRLAGTAVTATEPVLGYMFDALGLQVRNRAFQLAVMNNTEPSASEIAAFENDLKTHKVKLIVYNSQVTAPLAQRMQQIAKTAGIPVVGAAETEPAGETYQSWIIGELEAIDRALAKQAP